MSRPTKTLAEIWDEEIQETTATLTDEATAESIKDWFGYRYPCTGDSTRFKVYYRRQLRKYAGKYNAMVRIEGIDATIDPMVNRYFEQLYRSNASDENTKKYGKTSNVSRETSGVTSYGKTQNENSTTDETTTYGRTSADDGTITDTTAYGKTTTEGETTNGRTTYGKGTADTGTVETSTIYGRKNTQTHDATDNTNSVSDEKQANKQTPMSADGSIITTALMQAGTGGNVTNAISKEDWTTATAYGQTTGQNAQNGTHKGTDTAQDSGTDTTTEKRTLNTTTSGSDTTTGDRDKQTETSGKDTKTRSITTTNTQGGKDVTSGKFGTTTTAGGQDTQTGTDTTDTAEGGADHYTGSAMTKETNRYTGREQLTPQQALSSAIEYLQTISPAFEWLCDKMEPVFYAYFEV